MTTVLQRSQDTERTFLFSETLRCRLASLLPTEAQGELLLQFYSGPSSQLPRMLTTGSASCDTGRLVTMWHEAALELPSNSRPITCALRVKGGVRGHPSHKDSISYLSRRGFHGDNTGSNPVGDANITNNLQNSGRKNVGLKRFDKDFHLWKAVVTLHCLRSPMCP